MRALRDFLVISRARIQIASLPTALIGCALAARSRGELRDAGVLLYVLMFFVVLTFACNLNCLTDAEVDALHKREMSEAVRALGEKRIMAILGVEAVLAVVLAVLLAVHEKKAVFLAGAATLAIAYAYSAPPLRVKKRGWLSPVPVVLGLYALPPLGGWYLIRGSLNGNILVFAIAYAMLMEGLTIVNTCEDQPEDEATGVRTLAHALGIRRALVAGAWLAGVGGAVAAGVVLTAAKGLAGGASAVAPGGHAAPGTVIFVAVATLAVAYGAGVVLAVGALRGLARADDPAAGCKLRARHMPAWFLLTRYPLLLMALLLK